MFIMVLADQETFSQLNGCTIYEVDDGLDLEATEEVLAAGAGELIAEFGDVPASFTEEEAKIVLDSLKHALEIIELNQEGRFSPEQIESARARFAAILRKMCLG